MESIIGTLAFRDWDRGVFGTLEAEVAQYTVDATLRNIYVLNVPGVDSGLAELGGRVPMKFANPEDSFSHYRLPAVLVRRNDMQPAFQRKPWYGISARAPSPDAVEITLSNGQKGWSKYREQWRAVPWDINYDVVVMGRLQNEVDLMLTYVLRHFRPPGFVFKVIDSKGDVRKYDAQEVSVSSASELADIADRTIAWSVAFTALGEVDLEDSVDYTSFTGASALTSAQKISLGIDPDDPLYSRVDLILRTHMGVDPAKW